MEINAQTASRAKPVWSVFLRTITFTSHIYLAAQLYFAIAALMGLGLALGIDSSLILTGLDKASFETVSGAGGALMLIGMTGAMMCGLLTCLVSIGIFWTGKCHVFPGLSILILAICTICLLMPVINLFPIMWFWNWYVAWSNLKGS